MLLVVRTGDKSVENEEQKVVVVVVRQMFAVSVSRLSFSSSLVADLDS